MPSSPSDPTPTPPDGTTQNTEAPARTAAEPPAQPPVEKAPLLTLRDGLPAVTDTAEGLAAAVRAIGDAEGPVAIDAERASGYRYSSRAYLIQLRRGDSGTWLVDPIAFESLDPLQEAIGDAEWILHAATQDLPCLREVGLHPAALFDTELAGRLLGYPRVGLATLVETIVGRRMRKEHSAVDWSTRPLPTPWLEYAALDVEVLLELRDHLHGELVEAGKDGWAREEFEHLLSFEPTVRTEAWRRTSGVHKLRGRRTLGIARALWEARDEIASTRDVTPGRIIPDGAIVIAASEAPADRRTLLGLKGFHGRGAERYSSRWIRAIEAARALPEDALPTRTPRSDGPPQPRAWADKDPVAARRLQLARAALGERAEELGLPVENLITPDFVRRAMWTPPSPRDDALAGALDDQLARYGARAWQRVEAVPLLVAAIQGADAEATTGQLGETVDQGDSDGS